MIGDLFKGTGLAIVAGILAIIVLIVVGAMAIFGFGFFQRSTADFRGKTGQIERTRADPDYRIQAYESFYNECAAVQTAETRIANSKANLRTDEKGSDDWYRDRADLSAQENNRADLINSYNAHAREADTRAHFLASDLPYQLDASEEHTTCTV